MLPRRRAGARRLLTLLLLTLALAPIGLVSTSPAEATTLGQRAVTEASRHKGKPYLYGAVGPYKFDCSGFTLYVYGRLGKRLPHNSAQQYNAPGVRHVAKSSRTLGDLVFMRSSSGRITHVGIYAGSNRWWVAPKSGDRVKLQTLYSTNYVVGRII
jgi:peptidoglycan DL-endopeptidase CwlO